jgi:acetyl esterase/lipase
MRAIQTVLYLGPLLGSLGCGAGNPPLAPPPARGAEVAGTEAVANADAGAPDAAVTAVRIDPKTAFARELPVLPLQAVLDPRGRFRSKLEARRAPRVQQGEGVVRIRGDLGTISKLRCEIHDGPIDPGATIANLLAKTAARVDLQGVNVYRVSSVRGVPVVLVSAPYKDRKGGSVGELKVGISPRNRHSAYCLHDEAGYRQTFARAVESMLQSLETADAEREPQYNAVWEHRVGEVLAGYSWQRLYAEEDGTVLSLSLNGVLVQLDTGGVHIGDDTAARVHDRRGIVKGQFYGSIGATPVYEIELERSAAAQYAYRGKVAGKDISGNLEGGPIKGYYEMLLQLQKHRAPAAALEFRQDEYVPGLEQPALSVVNYLLNPKRDGFTLGINGRTLAWTLLDGLPGQYRTGGEGGFVATPLDSKSSLGPEPGVFVGEKAKPPEGQLGLVEQRQGFATQILADVDTTPPKEPPPKLFSLVRYRAPLGENVAYVSPVKRGKKRPAIIWIAGGFEWGIGESAWAPAPRDNDQSARALREAGLVLMLPALRGSNGNPGKNECFFGEVDDVIAAMDYLAGREDVDPSRIYLGGHSTGGSLALLVAAAKQRFRAVFAFGPVGDARHYGTKDAGGCLPADAAPREAELRAPLNFVATIQTPTFVFEGAEGGNAHLFDALRERASSRVHFSIVPGKNHFSVLVPGTETIAKAILADQVDDSHLIIE